jgi:site-specific DNA-methyltransferase (adenine-specific)
MIGLRKGDCLELMKNLPDKSIDLFICDLPYGETNCKWDSKIDMLKFWSEFKRLRKSKRTACIHFCSTKFGYTLIKSWEKGYKMDLVWKKRNKTGGLLSRHRPMRNHEMVYFFYDQPPKYNRDKYHKRIQAKPKIEKSEPKLPVSVEEDKDEFGWDKSVVEEKGTKFNGSNFEPPNPASVIEEKCLYGFNKKDKQSYAVKDLGKNHNFEPQNPASVFDSEKVFIGKRHHQTEKPLDILEFFLKYWTDEGDTILDPTMGSGSTGVACKKLNRNFIGFELNEKIFKIAEKRILI